MFYVYDFLAHEWDEFDTKKETIDMVMEGVDLTRQGVIAAINRSINTILDGIEEGSDKLTASLIGDRYLVLDKLTYGQKSDIVIDVFKYEGLYAVSEVQFNEVFKIPAHRIRIMARNGEISKAQEYFDDVVAKSAFKKRPKPEDKLKAVVALFTESDDETYAAIGGLLSNLIPMCEQANKKRAENILGKGKVLEILDTSSVMFEELAE